MGRFEKVQTVRLVPKDEEAGEMMRRGEGRELLATFKIFVGRVLYSQNNY